MTLGITPIGRDRDVEFGIFVLFATIGLVAQRQNTKRDRTKREVAEPVSV
jgi:hypothetical protein